MGVIGGDASGYPNGRRPGDDVVDIALRVLMGKVCHLGLGVCNPSDAPVGNAPITDGVPQSPMQFDDVFPYLKTPNPGARNKPLVSTCSLCETCPTCTTCETCTKCDTCPEPEVCAGVQLQAVFAFVMLFLAYAFF